MSWEVSCSPLTHLALFQKYRCGTSSRAGPPCSGSSGSPSQKAVTYPAAVSAPSSSVSTETPSHLVPSLDHLVTQWMSFVISSEGSRLNSSQVHLLGSSISPSMEKTHFSSGVWGVGPAESTGKPSTRYCPEGSAASWLLRRPLNPREKNPSLMSRTSLLR